MWRTRIFMGDLALAAALGALSAAPTSLTAMKAAAAAAGGAKKPGFAALAHPLAFWWWFGALLVAGLLIRQRWPRAALVLAAAGVAAHELAGFKQQPLDLAMPLILFSVASQARSRLSSIAALSGTLLLTYALTVVAPLTDAKSVYLLSRMLSKGLLLTGQLPTQDLLLLVAAFAVGDGVRSRREHLLAIEERTAELARSQLQRAALAAAAERTRITRELHDVVAHGVSVMVVQAQGAAAALDRHPNRAAVALQHVIDTGRASLAEMRRLLAAGSDPAEEARLAPQPGLSTVPELVDDLRLTGMPVTLEVTGSAGPLPSAVDLSGYRIVQEALTNTLKHAGPGAVAAVRLTFRPDHVEVEVSDDGAGAPPGSAGNGNGLRGIAERVTMLGGRLTLTTSPGFRMYATLPLTTHDLAAPGPDTDSWPPDNTHPDKRQPDNTRPDERHPDQPHPDQPHPDPHPDQPHPDQPRTAVSAPPGKP